MTPEQIADRVWIARNRVAGLWAATHEEYIVALADQLSGALAQVEALKGGTPAELTEDDLDAIGSMPNGNQWWVAAKHAYRLAISRSTAPLPADHVVVRMDLLRQTSECLDRWAGKGDCGLCEKAPDPDCVQCATTRLAAELYRSSRPKGGEA